MDTIILAGVELYAHGGVTSAEKSTGQRYRVNLEMRLDLTSAARSDAIGDTVSYADAYAIVVDTMRGRTFNLLESAAGEIADRLLRSLPIEGVTVELQKLLPPIEGVVAYAAVRMSRDR